MIFYLLGLLICLALGFLLLRLMTNAKLGIILYLFLSLALGLGLVGSTAFYVHILSNIYDHWVAVGAVLLAIGLLAYPIFKSYSQKPPKVSKKTKTTQINQLFALDMTFTHAHALGLLTLALIALPLFISAYHYPLGGWDAWSCWNLKAKFIFLGNENWKDVLSPGLWRSNTNYPLLWPLINVWFFDLAGNFNQAVPMFNSILIALLTAGLLLFGLLELTGMVWIAIGAALIVSALPFGVTLLISQYSDSLLGLFLLSAFLTYLLAEKLHHPKLKILSMIFLGLMSFTKNEGLIAAGITAMGLLWLERSRKKELKTLIFIFIVAALPTIFFNLLMAPKNEAFVNGLTSSDKPTNWARLSVILTYPWFEMISAKWNGFWLLAGAGILLSGKKLWQSTLGIIGLSLILYLGIVLAYYAVNTFFEIQWWLSNTLSRIIFALIPTIVLWIVLGLKPRDA